MGVIVKNGIEYGNKEYYAGTVDTGLNTTSSNPVQNKVITEELNKKSPKESPVFTGNISLGRNGDAGANSVAIGNSVRASGSYSQSFGNASTASGNYSFAEGNQSKATGASSHAEGVSTLASGTGSHTSGIGTKSSQEGKMSTGKYNTDETDTLFEVGNGTNDTNRSNAMSVKSDGTIVAKKDIVLEDGGSVSECVENISQLQSQVNGFTFSLIDGVPYLVYDDGL